EEIDGKRRIRVVMQVPDTLRILSLVSLRIPGDQRYLHHRVGELLRVVSASGEDVLAVIGEVEERGHTIGISCGSQQICYHAIVEQHAVIVAVEIRRNVTGTVMTKLAA